MTKKRVKRGENPGIAYDTNTSDTHHSHTRKANSYVAEKDHS